MANHEDFESTLNAVGQGDRKAFLSLFDLTSNRLCGLCHAILDDDEWADEVLERAYREIWQNALTWQDSGLTALTWVLSMGRETAITARRDASDDGSPDPVELQTITPSKDVETQSDGPESVLRKALGWLPKDRQEAFLLSYFSGIRYSELATRFRVPYATMRNWQQRSLARLHADLSGKRASEDVLLAGEYVLDVIPAPEHEEFEQRMTQDAGLRGLVAGWTEDFIVLTDSVPDRDPRTDLLERLDEALFPELSKPIWKRLRILQTVAWVVIAVGIAWAAYTYWPGMAALLEPQNQGPQQSVAPISEPAEIPTLARDGDPVAVFHAQTQSLQLGGAMDSVLGEPNLFVYLDFGENTEWIALGALPQLPPRVLDIPSEIAPILKGGTVVILGGEGSDQEILRLKVN